MNNSVNILLLEDNFNDAELVQNQVLKSGIKFKCLHVSEWDGFVEAITSFKPDIILSDYNLGGFTGLDALEFAKKNCPLIPFIIVTGTLNDETAADTIKKGAWDYVVKERLTHLNTAIKNALNLKEEKEINAIAREKLKTNEERYRLVFDNSPDGLFIINMKGITIEANLAVSEILGLRNEDIIGKNFLKLGLLPENQIQKAIKIMGKKVFSKIQNHDELIIKRRDGSEVYLELNVHFFDYLGEKHMLAIARDISNRKQSEEELKQSYIFSSSLLKTIPFGMDIVDESGTVLFQSDNFKELIGENGIGKKCWELYKDDQIQCSDCPLYKGIKIGETDIYESHDILGGRVFEIIHTGMIYEGKKAMLEIFQDISQRKENEKELVLAKEKAEQSDKLKTAFLSNMSHEIRTPLNAILGFSQLLTKSNLNNNEKKTFSEYIRLNGESLAKIIDDIIDISKLQSKQLAINKTDFNLNTLFNELNNYYNDLLIQKSKTQISLELELPSSIDNNFFINSDEQRLMQIFNNLLTNAVKYTDKGKIIFGCKIVENNLLFFVKDTGFGIHEKNISKIFERFVQYSEQYVSKQEGTGLGLSICKNLVDLLGGELKVESELNKGSHFYFQIPLIKSEVQTQKEISPAFETNRDLGKYKILIADDEDSNYVLTKRLLKHTKVKSDWAINGRHAVDMATNNKYDLILMDIKMPEMDGIEATRLIKKHNNKTPIIMQTAFAMPEVKNKALQAGCDGFVVKPISIETFIELVNKHIQ
ncbi:MAG: response regulator [Salinivirgaceae bacterium]|nr:response regulator [Salinivirgaceae bacterium]